MKPKIWSSFTCLKEFPRTLSDTRLHCKWQCKRIAKASFPLPHEKPTGSLPPAITGDRILIGDWAFAACNHAVGDLSEPEWVVYKTRARQHVARVPWTCASRNFRAPRNMRTAVTLVRGGQHCGKVQPLGVRELGAPGRAAAVPVLHGGGVREGHRAADKGPRAMKQQQVSLHLALGARVGQIIRRKCDFK